MALSSAGKRSMEIRVLSHAYSHAVALCSSYCCLACTFGDWYRLYWALLVLVAHRAHAQWCFGSQRSAVRCLVAAPAAHTNKVHIIMLHLVISSARSPQI